MKKNLWGVFIFVAFFGIIIFFETKGYFERKLFYESKLNTTVVKIENAWSGRGYDYVTKEKVILPLIKFDSSILNLNVDDSLWVVTASHASIKAQ